MLLSPWRALARAGGVFLVPAPQTATARQTQLPARHECPTSDVGRSPAERISRPGKMTFLACLDSLEIFGYVMTYCYDFGIAEIVECDFSQCLQGFYELWCRWSDLNRHYVSRPLILANPLYFDVFDRLDKVGCYDLLL